MLDHPSFHRHERARLDSAGVLCDPDYGVIAGGMIPEIFTRSSAIDRPASEWTDGMARQLLLAEAR